MKPLKLYLTVDGKYVYKLLKLRPQKTLFMDSRRYAGIWSRIINEIAYKTDSKEDVVVILSANVIWIGESELYEQIQQKMKNGQLQVLAGKAYPDQGIKINGQETGIAEHQYVLAVDSVNLPPLIESLSDKDALEVIIAKRQLDREDLQSLLESDASKISSFLKYTIYFNGIHVGLTVEIYDGNIQPIISILKQLEMENICEIEEKAI